MSGIKQIDPNDWENFLSDFSTRNNDRRSRFQIFKAGNAEEESREYFFEEINFKDEEGQTITVTRIDRSDANAKKIHDRITNVTGIAVQFDTDGSEAALEIVDREKELIMLRFESLVDGVS